MPVKFPLFALIAASALTTARSAEIHGPIAVWTTDPTSNASIQWLTGDAETPAGVPGVENSWAEGRAPFGYGDDDDYTVFPEMKGQFSTIYLRGAFEAPTKLPETATLNLRVLVDDGFITYLNGEEVLRENVDRGSGSSAIGIKRTEAKNFETFDLGKAAELLKPGKNIFAIEGHNSSLRSTDFTLQPVLQILPTSNVSEAIEVLGKTYSWQYFAGEAPGDAWQTSLSSAPVKAGERPVPTDLAVGEALLEYRKLQSSDWTRADIQTFPFADTKNTVSRAGLTGLDADTTYEVKLTPGDGSDPTTRTLRTAPKTLTPDFKFVAGGDMYHTTELLDAMNIQAGEQKPLFALLGGDLAYANGRDLGRWVNFVDSWATNAIFEDPDTDTKRMIPMVVTVGNHEVNGSKQPRPKSDAKFYYSMFDLPSGLSRYAIDFGNYLSIILLDSDHSQPVVEQTGWLKDALASRENFPYLFVCYHKPTYGTNVKDPNMNVRKDWVPLFEKYHVDIAFENDHHVYKRSKLLYKNKEDPERGVLYIGDGAWGTRVRKIDEKKTRALGYLEHWESTNHLIAVKLSKDGVAIESTKADGEVFDEFILPQRRR